MIIILYVDLLFVFNYKCIVRYCVINRNVEVLLQYYVKVMKKFIGIVENYLIFILEILYCGDLMLLFLFQKEYVKGLIFSNCFFLNFKC